MRLSILLLLVFTAGPSLAKKSTYWWLFPKFDEHSPDHQLESAGVPDDVEEDLPPVQQGDDSATLNKYSEPRDLISSEDAENDYNDDPAKADAAPKEKHESPDKRPDTEGFDTEPLSEEGEALALLEDIQEDQDNEELSVAKAEDSAKGLDDEDMDDADDVDSSVLIDGDLDEDVIVNRPGNSDKEDDDVAEKEDSAAKESGVDVTDDQFDGDMAERAEEDMSDVAAEKNNDTAEMDTSSADLIDLDGDSLGPEPDGFSGDDESTEDEDNPIQLTSDILTEDKGPKMGNDGEDDDDEKDGQDLLDVGDLDLMKSSEEDEEEEQDEAEEEISKLLEAAIKEAEAELEAEEEAEEMESSNETEDKQNVEEEDEDQENESTDVDDDDDDDDDDRLSGKGQKVEPRLGPQKDMDAETEDKDDSADGDNIDGEEAIDLDDGKDEDDNVVPVEPVHPTTMKRMGEKPILPVPLPDELIPSGEAQQQPKSCDFVRPPLAPSADPRTVTELSGSDALLLCQLMSMEPATPLPVFRVNWIFDKAICPKGANSTCRTVLNTTVFESTSLSNASYIVPYTLLKLNHSDAGLYTCQVELHECSTLPDGVRVINSLPITVRLYTKPDYGVHLGIISAACVILVALLAGLYTYVKKIHGRSKSRYQELLSTVDIQYLPTKVLEPPNAVYNPTTTSGFIRMSATSITSKSSFTSNEEEA